MEVCEEGGGGVSECCGCDFPVVGEGFEGGAG